MQKKLSIFPFVGLIIVALIALFTPSLPDPVLMAENLKNISTGDTAWVMTSAALVLLMTPGLAYFYGGMVNSKNIVSTMLQSVIAMAVISVLWIVVGFSLAFGDDIGGFIGSPSTFFMFKGVLDGPAWGTIPLALFAFFQLKFAIITPALITGAFAERIRFTSYVLFI